MTKAVTDAMATATVLGVRLPMLWAMTLDPTPARRTEAMRMVSEKSAAFAAGAMAAQQQMMMEAMGFWMKAATGGLTPGHAAGAFTRAMEKGAAPARKSLKANARRLSRRGAI
jgi:hypothetical protein